MHGFNLPPAGPTTGGQAIDALGQLPQMIQNNQKQKLEIEQQKQSLEQAQSDAALKKLKLFYNMHSNDPTGQRAYDPAYVKAIKDAAKAAGVGSLVTIDPMTGMEVVDTHALGMLTGAYKTLADLTPEQQKQIAEANPGAQRNGIIESFGIDLKDLDPVKYHDLLTSAASFPPGTRAQIINQMGTELAKMPLGSQTPEGIIAQINLRTNELIGAEGSASAVADLQNYITSPAFVQQAIAPAVNAKLQQMAAAKVSAQAMAAYYRERTVMMPKQLAERIYWDGRQFALKKEDAETRRMNAQTNATNATNRNNLGWARIAATQANLKETIRRDNDRASYMHALAEKARAGTALGNLPQVKAAIAVRKGVLDGLQAQLKGLQAQENIYIAAGDKDDIPPELLTDIATLTDKVTSAQTDFDDLNKYVNSGIADSASVAKRTGKDTSDPIPKNIDVKNQGALRAQGYIQSNTGRWAKPGHGQPIYSSAGELTGDKTP